MLPILLNRTLFVTEAMKSLNSGLDVLAFPHPLLRVRNVPVKTFGDDLEAFTQVMFSKMYLGGGLGIAAPQLGVNKALFVANPSMTQWKKRELVFANPTLLEESGNPREQTEGCLSFPTIKEDMPVSRPESVIVHAFDVQGREFVTRGEGLLGRIIQHEMDHLKSRLFIDLDNNEKTLIGTKEEKEWIEEMENEKVMFEDGSYDELLLRKQFHMTEHQIEDIKAWMQIL